ncbi:uncharacterized protein LOC115440516 [Manduca sexta]|uniref:Protease inhibitor n=1 Tax=Manduca sexta TaxID=7130 RepID=A0A921YUS7_MANSE|nr:uncharacterized protein LOC115440516 [Manduca sexta]KAG6445545.1 hypothetical protein O3G_MSEX003953 [Manduca sexta]
MKTIIIVALFALVAVATAANHSRGCIYIMGRCQRECEEGTHAYTTGCSKKTPEPTCEEPNPVEEDAIICDYSACYCDAPNVRDTKTNKCVPLDQCS